MAPPPPCRLPRSPPPWLLLLLSVALLGSQARAEPAAGSAVPAQSRPCVDCHAFEFMQRALQDLRKTAYSLDSRGPRTQDSPPRSGMNPEPSHTPPRLPCPSPGEFSLGTELALPRAQVEAWTDPRV
ncbi:neuropeptide-like protein C4orf48 homolog isoform X2 [Hyaena hyaena]|uniref:neuropeptide-like protein C4orf48 homolog isoform X2 n=1 Tax=Hyaena hyaena TaxID=95912 RepID=UPI001923C487|nr:neuropeptide-like protein C4orf48 homolog isoform X2 [Hyaena hyaena]